MDYFYNSNEYLARAKIADRDFAKLFPFISSLISAYNSIISDKNPDSIDLIQSTYILKLSFKYMNPKDSNLKIRAEDNLSFIFEKITKLYILSGNFRGIEFIKKNMYLEFILSYDNKLNNKIFKEKILSRLGEKFRLEYIAFENKNKALGSNGTIL